MFEADKKLQDHCLALPDIPKLDGYAFELHSTDNTLVPPVHNCRLS